MCVGGDGRTKEAEGTCEINGGRMERSSRRREVKWYKICGVSRMWSVVLCRRIHDV